MPNRPTCQTCKWWCQLITFEEREESDFDRYSECDTYVGLCRLLTIEGAGGTNTGNIGIIRTQPHGPGHRLRGEPPTGGLSNSYWTNYNFGCVHHEPSSGTPRQRG